MNQFAIYLMGGLGNQIFQYLFALKLREHFCCNVSLMADWYLTNQLTGRVINRPLLLHRIPGIKFPISTLGLAAEGNTLFSQLHHYEQDGGWGGIAQKQNENTLIFGYFQSSDALPSKPEMDAFCASLMPENKYNNHGVVAIHLRLGDYLNYPEALPTLPLNYYEKAMAAQSRGSHFVIFSENAAEACEYFRPVASRYSLEFLPPADPLDDFIRLASSTSIIGANSTFSYLAGLIALRRGTPVWLPSAEYWHGTNYPNEISGKRELLAHDNFLVIT